MNNTDPHQRPRPALRNAMGRLLSPTLLLGGALAVFIFTDRWFTIIDDETSIVEHARQPLLHTISLFWLQNGQHEHPPLSDILLHCWLLIGGSAQWSIRLPSIVFYLAALFILAMSAAKIAGNRAFRAVILVGVLWPFGFHFGRMVGWYSFCFFLVSGLTLAYLRYLDRPTWPNLAAFVSFAVLLVYSNYYGWAVISCLALDIWFSDRVKSREAGKLVLATFGTLIIAYAPLWNTFLYEVRYGTHPGNRPALVSALLKGFYNLFTLFLSESIAPWFWYLSVPASFAIVATIILTVRLLPPEGKRFFAYFSVLLGSMAVLDIIDAKRLLFISGWLLLTVAIALANRHNIKGAQVLLILIVFLGGLGWVGILARTFYAAPHFIEPWPQIAEDSVRNATPGTTIISNSPSFLFEAQYPLRRLIVHPGKLEETPPQVFSVDQWIEADHAHNSSVMFVKGVNKDASPNTQLVESWLIHNCVLRSEKRLIRDSGYELKAHYFPNSGQQQFRITLQQFDCSLIQ